MVDFHKNPSVALATFVATIFIKPNAAHEINIGAKNTRLILEQYKRGVSETQSLNQSAMTKKRGFFSKKPTAVCSSSLQTCFDGAFIEFFKNGELSNAISGVQKNYYNNQTALIKSITDGSFNPHFTVYTIKEYGGGAVMSSGAMDTALEPLEKFKTSFQALGLNHLSKMYKLVESLK